MRQTCQNRWSPAKEISGLTFLEHQSFHYYYMFIFSKLYFGEYSLKEQQTNNISEQQTASSQ